MALKKNLLYSFVFLSGFIFSQVQFLDTDILNADEAFIFSSSVNEDRITLSWDIKPGYYLYKKSILLWFGQRRYLRHKSGGHFGRIGYWG